MSRPMFGSSSNLTGSTDGNRHLLEFRAGRMTLTGTTVTADLRRGLVYLYRTEDFTVHFCWKNRNDGRTEEDLLIVPHDSVFTRVTQCTTGRVYLLKFKTDNRKFFFWMQEPSDAKDEKLCKRVNDIMNHIADDSDVQSILGISLNRFMSLFGRGGRLNRSRTTSTTFSHSLRSAFVPLSVTPGRTPPKTLSVNTSANTALPPSTPNQPITTTTPLAPIRMPTIRISSLASSSCPSTTSSSSSSAPSGLKRFFAAMQAIKSSTHINVDLSSVITADLVLQLLGDSDHPNALLRYLPPIETDENSKVQLGNTILSPQFREALSLFSSAFLAGQLGPILSQFNLNNEACAAANFGHLEAFIRALEESAIQPVSTNELISTEEDDDEDMEGGL